MRVIETKVQTGIRLNPELYNRLKIRAKKENKSFNRFVEGILESAAGLDYPKLEPSVTISEETLALGETLPHYTPDELSADERLAYLLSK